MRKLLAYCAALSLGAAVACTVHQDSAPSPSGPSTNAIAVTLTATPDTLPQNGTAQSIIRIKAYNAGGQPLAGLSLRLEMQLNGVTTDFGSLSVRNVVTGADGTASAVYTAPAGPNSGGLGTTVALLATPVSGDAANQGILNSVGAVSQAYVRLVADGLTNPGSADTPTAAFTTAGSLNAGAVVLFNGTSSTSGGTASTLVNWDWDFGDGTAHGNGSVVTHAFATARPYAVTLTVTNSLGRSASTLVVVTIGAGTGPTALFTALPNPVTVGGTVTLDATASTGNPHIINYRWTITPPVGPAVTTGGPDAIVTFSANVAGLYTISLTVTDSDGKTSAATVNTVLAQ